MKTKVILSSLVLMGLVSCTSQRLVQRSSVCLTSPDEKYVYFKDTDMGRQIFDAWQRGYYGNPDNVHLIDSLSFHRMVAIRVKPYEKLQR